MNKEELKQQYDELEQKYGMDKTEIKKIQRAAQKLLEQLQGTEASFLFVGDEGNCFAIGGDTTMIATQILFAMVRYPVVKDIIKKCADNYETLNEKFGEDVRSLTLEHLIEVNSGN